MTEKKHTTDNQYPIQNHSGTPYDDVHRTLMNDCPGLLIPVVNELFHKNHKTEDEILVLNNELFLNRQDGNQLERITDSNLKIEGQRYHIECQSNEDGTILIRMFEYDSQIALQDAFVEGNELNVIFPSAAVIYLRSTHKTPEYMTVNIEVPNDNCSYQIPTLKVNDYSIEEKIRKKLYYLIPFHIFQFEHNFKEYNIDEEKRKELVEEFRKLIELLEKEASNGNISEYIKRTIIDMSKKVLRHISAKYENVRESVGEIMGGQILEYEAKDILNKGIAVGLEVGERRGLEQGAFQKLIEQVKRKLAKGQSVSQIAEDLLEDEDVIKKIIEEYTVE